MQDFRKLTVWGKSHQLTLAVYRATEQFPQSELYGLRSQLRRASASIAANIAEGCGRGSPGDFGRLLDIAAGSASEVEYHLILACDLRLIFEEDAERLNREITDVKRMLSALISRVRPSPRN
jgi:four helix bundle protein